MCMRVYVNQTSNVSESYVEWPLQVKTFRSIVFSILLQTSFQLLVQYIQSTI